MKNKLKLDTSKDKLARLAVSFLMAFFLWVYALSATGQTETKQFNDIPVRILNESALTAQGLALDEVDFTVDVKLYGSTLQVSQIRKSALSAVLDVSGVSSVGNHSVAVSISGMSENVSVSEIRDRYLSVSVSELKEAEKSIEIVKTGNVAEGYSVITQKSSSNIAKVYGNSTNVGKVAYVRGSIDINSTQTDITRRAILTAYDENGNKVEHVSISPEYVDVSFTVGKIKEIPVKVVTTGNVSEGYVLSDIILSRETVKVAARQEILDVTDYIYTSNIDLTGKSASFSQTVSLHGEDGMIILDAEPVKVELTVEMKENKEVTFNTVKFRNVPDGFSASLVEPVSFSAVFSGDKRILEQIDSGDITAYVDLAGYSAGEFTVPVLFDVPEGVELKGQQDIKVRVELKK